MDAAKDVKARNLVPETLAKAMKSGKAGAIKGQEGAKHDSQVKLVDYYWYQKNSLGVYVFDHIGAEPTSGCSGLSDNYCSKGFLPQNNPTNPSQITDATDADADRFYDE